LIQETTRNPKNPKNTPTPHVIAFVFAFVFVFYNYMQAFMAHSGHGTCNLLGHTRLAAGAAAGLAVNGHR
jgi:hypothetical protein